jgi:hypothetical protein
MAYKYMTVALLVAAAFAAPAEAHQRVGQDTIKARQKFFGAENVDPHSGAVDKDKVIFSWATNTTFVTSIQGRIVMLDSFITRPELPTTPLDRRYAKALPQDFVDVNPEAIFIGHGHGDHADNAAFIAKWTGATIYASPETCDVMQADVARMASDLNLVNGGAKIVPDANPVRCVGVVPRGSYPGNYDTRTGKSTAAKLSTSLDQSVCVLAFKFLHSASAPVDQSFVHPAYTDLGDPRFSGRQITTPAPAITYPAMFPVGTSFTPPADRSAAVPGQMNTTTTGSFGLGGPTTIYYQFILRNGGYNFSFSFLDSIGPAKEGIGSDPGLVTLAQYTDPNTDPSKIQLARNIGASLFDLMDNLPAPDILFMAGAGNDGPNNQGRDIVYALQHLRPKVYYPTHFTSSVQPGSGPYHVISIQESAVNMGYPQNKWPEFRLLADPTNFFVPNVFYPNDARWADTNKSARAAHLCN